MSQRILYIIDSLKVGGAETLLLDLLDEAARRGDTCHVAFFSEGPLESAVKARGVDVTRLSSAGIRDPRAVFRAIRLMRRWRPDVVHTHLVKSDLVGQMAARLARMPKRIVTFHNTDPWLKNPVLSWAYRTLTANADAYVAVSANVADYIANTGGCDRDKIHVIDNGVDLTRFDSTGTTPVDLAQFGIPSGAFTVGIVGRLSEQKDHTNFLDAAAKVANVLPDVHFVIVGDGPLRHNLEARAAELGLMPKRLVFTGIIHDMPGLLCAVQAIAISSRWEGMPMTLLEAMAMRLPVVSTAVGGVPDLIEDGVNGLLVPAENPEQLANAIIRIASDQDLRRRIGAAARANVEHRFDQSIMSRRLSALYSDSARDARRERQGAESDGSGALHPIKPGE